MPCSSVINQLSATYLIERANQSCDAYVRLVQMLRVGLTCGNLKLRRFRDSWLQANSSVIRLPLPIDRKT